MKFEIVKSDGYARRGKLFLRHGLVETPAFMPVGTQAAVRSVSPQEVKDSNSQIVLGNTFHLMLRPGSDLIRAHGGLHNFMGWDNPILTDSGGFQVWSLATNRKLDESGVLFKSPITGEKVFLNPEKSIDVQIDLNSDIAMVFDECTTNPITKEDAAISMERSMRWAKRCKMHHDNAGQALFGIAQGSVYQDLRTQSLGALTEIGFDGYALGGLAVGEGLEEMYGILDSITPLMPWNQPRYLMGVGKPENIVVAVKYGIDMFDCVIPTRNARNGWLYTSTGIVKIRNAENRTNLEPIDQECPCPACLNYSRSYIRHLLTIGETLGLRLCTLHNLYFFQRLMSEIRHAIACGNYDLFVKQFFEKRGDKSHFVA